MTDVTEWKNREETNTNGAIYCIINERNGKVYVGSTSGTAWKRVARHICE